MAAGFVAHLFRGEGSLATERKSPASIDAGYNGWRVFGFGSSINHRKTPPIICCTPLHILVVFRSPAGLPARVTLRNTTLAKLLSSFWTGGYSDSHAVSHRFDVVSVTVEGPYVGQQETRIRAADYRETPGNTSTGGQAGFGKNGGNSDEH